ncbi:acid-sensing ion channel 1B isoform X3 [Carassius auratus]|uniref:Acid-sensing ion channel 1 n=1 Tax=Carassius auratus TaxID=7957 RepID=A0A6P6N916_CARAU|nr:acid-sensing ion channel 1B isoform X3 [Carassius auratus]XP_052394797.1 acid-sensing ion channel 1B isoform X2 [Carassius gibelio]
MVRITCTLSFSTDDEPVGRSRQGSFDDQYKRVVWSRDGEHGKYQEEGDDPDTCDGTEDEEVPDISLATFFDGCSLHGANHVFVDKKFSVRRGLWTVVFLLAISMFLMQVVDRVIYYLQYDYITLLDERNAKNMTFPAITFCNYNSFRRSQLSYSDLLFMGPMLGYEDNMAPGIPLAPEPDRQGSRFRLDEFFNRTRHRMDDMLLECKFSGNECGPEHWREIFTRYGKCYTFNSGQDGRPLLVTMMGGMGNGLELMLDIQQDEYLPVWGETDETSFEAGIKVQIHTQDEPPFIDQLGFGVAPGFQTFVSCQEQRLTYLPPPWGDCKASAMDSDFFSTYSITACRIDCETRYLVENCNCRMVHMPGDAPYCTPEQYKECADPALDFLVERDNDYCVCETPCNMTRYGKELSFVKIPSKASAKYLAKKFNKTEQYIAENILVLDIFFEALNYETIEQKKAYEIAGLLGDIGGQMGLFIGASILTILELFDYLYEVIKFKLCRCAKKKHQRSSNGDRGAVLSLDDVKRHVSSL